MDEMYDHMELGDSGVVPQAGGWFLDTNSKRRFRMDEEGNVYDEEGNHLGGIYYDPADDDDNE